MKKMMMTLAAGLTATAMLAVESQNVVGYYSPVLTNGYNMLAFNFEPIDGAEGIDLQELIKIDAAIYAGGTTRISASTVAGNADEIRVWDAGAGQYQNYFLYRAALGTTTTRNFKWVSQADATVLADVTVKPGQAVWYVAKNAAGVALPPFAGQVPTQASAAAIPLAGGYNMIGSGFTAGWTLNKPDGEGGYDKSYWSSLYDQGKVAASTVAGNADEVRVWDTDAGQYQNYFLYRAALGTTTTRNFLWVSQADAAAIADVTVGMDAGVWYVSKKTGVAIDPDVPYTLD